MHSNSSLPHRRIRTRSQSLSTSEPDAEPISIVVGVKNAAPLLYPPNELSTPQTPSVNFNPRARAPYKYQKITQNLPPPARRTSSPEKIIRASSKGAKINRLRTPIFSYYHRPGGLITRSQMKTYYTHPSSQGYWLSTGEHIIYGVELLYKDTFELRTPP